MELIYRSDGKMILTNGLGREDVLPDPVDLVTIAGSIPATEATLVMPKFKIPAITKVHQPADRVVICTFSDGATTKAICHSDDKFSLDTAISVCVTKYIFQKFIFQKYHRYIKDALQLVERQKKEAEQKEADERLRQSRIAKAKLRKEAYKMRKRDEEILQEAQVQALAFGLIMENLEKSDSIFPFTKENDDGEH